MKMDSVTVLQLHFRCLAMCDNITLAAATVSVSTSTDTISNISSELFFPSNLSLYKVKPVEITIMTRWWIIGGELDGC